MTAMAWPQRTDRLAQRKGRRLRAQLGTDPWRVRSTAASSQCRPRRPERQPRWPQGFAASLIGTLSAPLLAPALLAATPDRSRFPGLQPPPGPPRLDQPCPRIGGRHFAVIVVGDEPAAVMTLLELRRQFDQVPSLRQARLALVTDADLSKGIGGTLVRSGLAYLDRNQVPSDMGDQLPLLAPSSDLYARFLRLTGVNHIAVDPPRASRAFRQALRRARIEVLPRAGLLGVRLHGRKICTLETRRLGSLGADLFIDASLEAQLTQLARVPRHSGMGGPLYADQSLALGWIFELEGFTYGDLLRLEHRLTHRLLDPNDAEARQWLELWPQYRHDRARLRADLLTSRGTPRLAFSSTSDSIDQRSPAVAIAFHGQARLPPGLTRSPARLDVANIAVLRDRVSVNALLFRNDARQNRAVLAADNRPLPWMQPVADAVTLFFRRHGARKVTWMPELYVRSVDQIAHPLDPLSAERMAAGGVPRQEALGTFSYFLDFRGGLAGLLPMAKPTFNFGYRHTLPREISNLAVLGPAAGFAGLGEGAGRIIELNISVGQGLAIASTLALKRRILLADVDPLLVAQQIPDGYLPYGRPSTATALQLWLRHLDYRVTRGIPGSDRVRLPWHVGP